LVDLLPLQSGTVAVPAEKTCACTYTQGGWGAQCNGGNIACTRDAGFSSVYSTAAHPGINYFPAAGYGAAYATMGNHTTKDLIFTSAAAIDAYLPNTTAPATISGNTKNPVGAKSSTYGGTLGGNLLALKLSLDYDAAGLLHNVSGFSLGSHVVQSGPFKGQSVAQVEAAAELVLAGGALPAGVTLSSLTDVLSALTANYDDCTSNGGLLAAPVTP
jgi:hypothetical protein